MNVKNDYYFFFFTNICVRFTQRNDNWHACRFVNHVAFAPNKKYEIKCKIQPMRTANFFNHVLGCEIITKSISALITTNIINHLSRNRGLFHKAGFLEAQGLLAWKRGNSEETKGKLKPRNSVCSYGNTLCEIIQVDSRFNSTNPPRVYFCFHPECPI